MNIPANLTDLIAKLAQAGGAGLGLGVLMFAALVVWKGQPADRGLAAFRMRVLTLGFGLAFFALVISLAQFTLGRPVEAGPGRMSVTFSPSFAAENLPTPAMQLIGGTSGPVVADEPFTVAPGTTLKITADQLIQQARSVKQLAATAQNALASNVQLTAALSAAPPPAPARSPASIDEPPTAAAVTLIPPAELFKLRNAQSDTLANLKRGNYAAAAATSKGLSQVRIGSKVYALGPPQPQP